LYSRCTELNDLYLTTRIRTTEYWRNISFISKSNVSCRVKTFMTSYLTHTILHYIPFVAVLIILRCTRIDQYVYILFDVFRTFSSCTYTRINAINTLRNISSSESPPSVVVYMITILLNDIVCYGGTRLFERLSAACGGPVENPIENLIILRRRSTLEYDNNSNALCL